MEIISARAISIDERMQELLSRAEEIEKSGDMMSAYFVSKKIEIALAYDNVDKENQKENKDERVFFVELILETKKGKKEYHDYCFSNSKEDAISIFCDRYKFKSRLFA